MALFNYVAYNTSGVEQKGRIDAVDEATARARLEQQQLLVADLKEASTGLNANVFGEAGLNFNDVEFFTAELSLLLSSGLRVDKGLEILLYNVEKPALRELLQTVLQELKQGHTLSGTLAKFPVFSSLYVGLVEIAEETGELAATFERLAAEMHYQVELRDKIKQALVYPAVILTVCVAAVVFIFNFVVPNLTTMFEDAENLPGYTRALLAVSDFFLSYQWILLIGLVVGGFGLWYYREHSVVKRLGAWCRERMPVVKGAN